MSTTPKRANGDGSVRIDKARTAARDDGRTVWRVAVTEDTGRRRFARVVGVKADATDKLHAMLGEAATGERAAPRRPSGSRSWTTGEWVAYYLGTVIANRKGRHGTGLSASSKRREAWAAAQITAALGTVPLRALRPEAVESFLTDRAHNIGTERGKAWSAAACRDVRNLLARALDTAIVRQHMTGPNPARQIGTPGREAEARYSLTADEAQRLYAAAMHNGTLPALVVAFQISTGMRPGEALGMQWGRVDLREHTARIAHAKTPTGIRVLHLAAPALAALRAAAIVGGTMDRTPDAFVFPGVRKAHVSERALIDMVRELCEAEGIKVGDGRYPHPHELRHTYASLLLDADIAPQKVAALLGDRLETVLRVYHHHIKPVAGKAEAATVAALFEVA